ncbi:hypothetical protein GCM10023350_13010 [Nocardioides endophyticus]|uniref:DUF4760 domain-containing protein n=1 Tax=Nocardioides endophyticus TaxID=1353775 RepID=A0ABP8YL13_9ACTN
MGNQVSTTALVAVALAGGVGAFLAGLVAAFVNWQTENRRARREHETWLREQKYAAYSELAATARIIGTGGKAVGVDSTGAVQETLMMFNQRYYCALLLMGGDNLGAFEQAHKEWVSASEKGNAARDMLSAMRADFLGTTSTNSKGAAGS